MENVKTIVFDLDGTIYQNNDFCADYIHFLLEDTDKIQWEKPLAEFVDGILAGRNLTMNAYYKSDILPDTGIDDYFRGLKAARLPDMPFEEAIARSDVIYLGDAWAVTCLVGKTLGLLENGRGDNVYRKTREKMSRDGMFGDSRLREAIRELSRHYETVLLTNSYEQTARDFLVQLGFQGIFRKVVYSANKPYEMANSLALQCPQLRSCPESFLSVGDHAFNDLMPLKALGCRTLWINPFENVRRYNADITVGTLKELAECLEHMCQ